MKPYAPVLRVPPSLRHYDLHVWMWKDNPRGMFISTNSAIKCDSDDSYTIALGVEHKH